MKFEQRVKDIQMMNADPALYWRNYLFPGLLPTVDIANARDAHVAALACEAVLQQHGSGAGRSAPPPEDRARRIGHWLRSAHGGKGSAMAFRGFDREGVLLRAADNVNGAQGGYLCPDEVSSALYNGLNKHGLLRRLARVEHMASDVSNVPRRTARPAAAWVAQGAAIEESTGSYDSLGLSAKKLAILTKHSNELEEDSVIDLAQQFLQDAIEAFGAMEDEAGLRGDGSATYRGITGLAWQFENSTSLVGSVAAASGHNTLAEIDASDLSNVMAAVSVEGRKHARWIVGSETAAVLDRISTTNGSPCWGVIDGELVRMYGGYRVEVSSVMDRDSWAAGDCPIIFGSLDLAICFGDRREISVMNSDARGFAEDEISLRATERIDINCHNVGSSTERGPVSGLLLTS